MADPAPTFAELTAVHPVGPGAWDVEVDPSWVVVRGPNGGLVAAAVLRGLTAHLDGLGLPEGEPRSPRSLTVHFTSPAVPGPARLTTEVVRSGRSLVTLSARLSQGDAVRAVALAAFSPPWPGPGWTDLALPDAIGFDAAPPFLPGLELPFTRFWEYRQVFGGDLFSSSDRAEIGGWIRWDHDGPAEAPLVDAVLVAAMADSWPPATYTVLDRPAGAPTVDLTVHFRCTLPTGVMAPGDPVLARFRTRTMSDGMFEEDGLLWAPDGTLLAQSRQLAILQV